MTKRLELEELTFFCDDLSTMYASGIATDEALLQMRDDAASGSSLAAVLPGLSDSVGEGASFSEAVSRSGAFPPDMSDMLEVGRKTGRTEQVLSLLATRYRREALFLAHLRSATLFPTVLQLVVVLILLALTFWVIPVFADVYNGLASGLVPSSFDYLAAARYICYVALVVALVVLICLFSLALVVSVRGRTGVAASGILMHLPGMKRVGRLFNASNLLALLNLFITSGVPVSEAMDQSLGISGDFMDDGSRASISSGIAAGALLGDTLRDADIVDALHGRRLSNAERTGTIESALGSISEELEESAVDKLDGIVTAVEPTLSIILAVVVGAALVSVMLPLVGIMGGIG